jgi:hypothetical protein
MPLNIIETTLEKVKPEHHALYVEKDGKYHLDLRDLEPYVENQLKPLRSDLETTREHERKLLVENGLGSALQRANIRPGYTDLVIANLDGQVALETVNNKRVVRIAQAEGGMPMVGSGEGGVATLDDLVKQAAERFPSMFKKPGEGETPAPGNTGGSGPKTLTRSDFEALGPAERMAKVKAGFTVVEPPAKNPQSKRLGEKEILRSAFDALPPREQATKVMREGYKVVD